MNTSPLQGLVTPQQLTAITQLPHFDATKGEYVNLDKFWNSLRNGKKYTAEFNQYSVSPSPLGTKKDNNLGLVCVPSTNTLAGQNDYANIGLFMSIDVNAYVDANDDYHVTAMKGDARFKADGTNGDVYVMAMPGYIKMYSDANVWGVKYSDAMYPGYELLDEAVKPDRTIRPYLLHAKYPAGTNPVDGKLASISGVAPEYISMSHNDQITKFKAKGAQYSGKTSHDDFYVQLMVWLKYATTNSQSVAAGCTLYYLHYKAAIAETGVTRIVVTNAQAATLVVGSCVSVGDYTTGTDNPDPSLAQNYNLANRVKILSIVPLVDGINTAINLDTTTAFSTTLTSTITTYPWRSGSCDNVLGQDGSPSSLTSGKEPFIINGIETMVGGYEVLQNLIIHNDNSGAYKITVYANYDCKTYTTSPNADYDLVGYQIAQTNNAWAYGTKLGIDINHPSVLVMIEAVGSSTTGFADGVFSNTPTEGYREWLSLGVLANGAGAGFRCLNAYSSLSASDWYILGRLSATGRSRRRAGVN